MNSPSASLRTLPCKSITESFLQGINGTEVSSGTAVPGTEVFRKKQVGLRFKNRSPNYFFAGRQGRGTEVFEKGLGFEEGEGDRSRDAKTTLKQIIIITF